MDEKSESNRLEQELGDVVDRRSFVRTSLASGLSVVAIGNLLGSVLHPAPARAQSSATPTGTLTFANSEPATSNYWDPEAGIGTVDDQVGSLVFDTLIAFDEHGAMKPSVATSWKRLSASAVEATIRSDVMFQDGTKLRAEDVKASFDRLGLGKLARSIIVTPGIAVEIKDPTTIVITTPKPFGLMENAMASVKIVPESYIKNPDRFKVGPIGSGPYKFVSYKGSDVTLTANDAYWGGAPKIKTVIFRYIEDPQARLNALLDGQVDIMTRVSAEEAARVKGNPDFSIYVNGAPSQILAILQHNGPLADPRLRQAIAYAVDRRSIASDIMEGMNTVGLSSLPTNVPYYQPLEPDFAYDPDKARALLAEAGHADGLALRMATASLMPKQLEIDQAISASLQQVGISTQIERLEVGAFRSSYNAYDISLNALTSFDNDADFILGLYTGGAGQAIFHMNDATFDGLCDAQREAPADTRGARVTEAAGYLWKNQAALYVSDDIWHFIISKRVKNYRRAPLVGEPMLPQVSVA